MFSMDLKCKGISWVGNVYQKFEAMCFEVEDIMCQETAKYVENQVQTVGVTVKKFYSEVMQDLVPPSVEQRNDIKREKKPKVAIQEDHIKEKPTEEVEVEAPLGKDSSHASSFGILHNVSHSLHSSSLDPNKEEWPDFSIEENEAIEMDKNPKTSIEEDSIKDKPPLAEKDLSQTSLSSEFQSKNDEKSCDTLTKIKISPLTSVENTCLSSVDSVEREGSDFSLDQIIAVGIDKNPKVSIEDSIVQKLPPTEMLKMISPVEKDISQALLSSGFSNENNEKPCDRGTKITPPTSTEDTSCISPRKTGHIGNNLLDLTGCAANVSTSLTYADVVPVLSSEDTVAESGCVALSEDSDGIDFTTYDRTYHIESLKSGQSLKSGHELDGRLNGYNAELTKSNDAIEPGIDPIEVFHNVKLEESCILVDSNELGFNIPPTPGKHRFHKKTLRDAFASRMRSTKGQEYEQLAFWYGDIDSIFDQERSESSSLPTYSMNLDLKTYPGRHFCESEWELL